VTLFGDRALQTWIAIEADPTITAFCERPIVARAHKPPRVIDFWVERRDGEELWLVIREREQAAIEPGEEYDAALREWARAEGMQLRVIKLDEVALSDVAFENWRSALHYLAANHDLLSPALIESLKQSCESGETLHCLERLYSNEDPVLIRSGLFCLLHKGVIQADDWQTVPLSPAMRFHTT